jgi:uncharacterized membrane protein
LESTPTKKKSKNLILETIKREKPENAEKLKQLMLKMYSINPESTTELLIELENEGKMHFSKPETPTSTSTRVYVFSEKALWYWEIIALSIATAISVFTIPETTYPVAYVRNALGLLFVLFLPGYTFIKALFPTKASDNTRTENLDKFERFALSVATSIALVPLAGLLLNYTPWGIRLTPITLSLLALTIVFATAALLREYQASAQAGKSDYRS